MRAAPARATHSSGTIEPLAATWTLSERHIDTIGEPNQVERGRRSDTNLQFGLKITQNTSPRNTTQYKYRGALARTCHHIIHVLGAEERRFREQSLDTRSTGERGGTPQKHGWIRQAAFRNASNRAKPRLDGERRHRSDH
jgi:hypothetical protein